jgi:hypothetical protein
MKSEITYRTERTRSIDDPPRNIILVDHLKERLEEAAQLAESALKHCISNVPETIVISGKKHCSVVVDEIRNSTGIVHFVVYSGAPGAVSTPFIKVPKEKFRYVYFEDLTDCRVFIKCKLLRIMFRNVNSSQISLRAPVIGIVEFYKCNSSNLSVRIPVSDDENPPIPVTTIEDCQSFNIFQSIDTLVYLVKLCIDVSGTIVDLSSGARISRYDLGKLFWDPQERTLICLSRSEGFAAVSMQYVLNDLEHHIIVKPPSENQCIYTEESFGTDFNAIFGTTPPTNNAWKERMWSKK